MNSGGDAESRPEVSRSGDTWDGYFKIYTDLQGGIRDRIDQLLRILPEAIPFGRRGVSCYDLEIEVVDLGGTQDSNSQSSGAGEGFLDWPTGLEVRCISSNSETACIDAMSKILKRLRESGMRVVAAANKEEDLNEL